MSYASDDRLNIVREFLDGETTGGVDDYPKDTAAVDEICAKERARLLINANCTKDSFFGYMHQGGRKGNFLVFDFPRKKKFKPYALVTWGHNEQRDYFDFEKFACYTGNLNIESSWIRKYNFDFFHDFIAQEQIINRFIPYTESVRLYAENGNNINVNPTNSDAPIVHFLANNWMKIMRQFCELYDELSLCGNQSAKSTCRHFENTCNPFEKLEHIGSALTQEAFSNNFERNPYKFPCIKNDEGKIDPTANELMEYFDRIMFQPMVRYYTLIPEYEERYGKTKLIYSFKNEYGHTIMKVLKYYDDKKNCFYMIPVTSWRPYKSSFHQMYAVPWATGKQPLYNLDLLMKDKDEDKIVVLTDSIEIADYMQEKHYLDQVVFTSFICQPGKYGQVDWSPLKVKRKENEDDENPIGKLKIVYLISNHSGIGLEEKYVEAKKLVTYLWDVEGIQMEEFWERDVEYEVDNTLYYINEFLETMSYGNPKKIVRLGEDKFKQMCLEAQELLDNGPKRFSAGNLSQEEDDKEEKEEGEKKIIFPEYILYPILSRGDTTLCVGPQKGKKSLFALAVSMIATNSNNQDVKPLFREAIWNIKKNDQGRHKVLYLNYENSEDTIEERIQDFQKYYWPQNPDEREKCRQNLIFEDLTGTAGVKCTDKAGIAKLFSMINEAEKKGNPGQEVDILIIDQASGFNGNDSNISNENEFKKAMATIQEKYPKMAILMLHQHTTTKNKVNPVRGMTSSFDNFQNQIVMSSLDDDTKIKDEFYMFLFQARRGGVIQERFKGKCLQGVDEDKFTVVDSYDDVPLSSPDIRKSEYKKNLKRVIAIFKGKKLSQERMAITLGMSPRTLQNHLKE